MFMKLYFLLFVNLFLNIVTSLLFFYLFKRKRCLFIKPSILIFLFMHVFLQWPLSFLDVIALSFPKTPRTCPTNIEIEEFYKANKK